MNRKNCGVAYGDTGGMRQLSRYIDTKGFREIDVQDESLKIRSFEISRTKQVNIKETDDIIEQCARSEGYYQIITATSQQKVRNEYIMWEKAKAKRIKYMVVIDNWCNYKTRFERDGRALYPEKVIVTDKYALEKATREIGSFTQIIYEDCSDAKAVAKQVTDKKSKGSQSTDNLLILLPPLDSIRTEEWSQLKLEIEIHKTRLITVRKHPLDRTISTFNKKLDEELGGASLVISNKQLVADLECSNKVIGFDSYALYTAMLANIETRILRTNTEAGEALVYLRANLDNLSRK